MPRASVSAEASSSFTGIPASAMDMAIPPPMVPAPTTAMLRMSGVGTSFGRCGSRATSRSAKKA